MRLPSARVVAPGVYGVATGRAIKSNVYLVRSDSSWALVDTGWRTAAEVIRWLAESTFGVDARPAAILLTHIHPDHSGSALPLARGWDVPVYVHPDELPCAGPDYPLKYMNPVDRRISAVVRRILPARTQQRMRAKATDLRAAVSGLDPDGEVPGMPEWRCVPTPGHTPGHQSFYRPSDRVLITGDAVLTMNPNSVLDLAVRRHRLSGPPRFFTWSRGRMAESVGALAALEPLVVLTGHGEPMTGPATASALRAFAAELSA
jgi:glyoxylase-like metal-dependent hydrolase (beta-lactamase superfamily II)